MNCNVEGILAGYTMARKMYFKEYCMIMGDWEKSSEGDSLLNNAAWCCASVERCVHSNAVKVPSLVAGYVTHKGHWGTVAI